MRFSTVQLVCSEHWIQSIEPPSLVETVDNTGSLVIKNSSIYIIQMIILWFIKDKIATPLIGEKLIHTKPSNSNGVKKEKNVMHLNFKK